MRRNGKLQVRSKDHAGAGIVSATILVEGTTKGTTSGADGSFSIKAAPDNVLVVSFMGLSVPHDQGGDANPDRRRAEREHTGYRRRDRRSVRYGKKRRLFTGSATVIKSDDIVKSQQSNVARGSGRKGRGRAADQHLGQPGESPKIRIRGFARSTPATIRSGSWTACPTRVT